MADLKLHYVSINKLLDERDKKQEEIRQAYKALAEDKYVPKVVRKIITLARMDPKQRDRLVNEQILQEEYAAELPDKTRKLLEELKAGSTLEVAAEQSGVSRSTAARAKRVSKNRKDDTARVSENPEVGTADGSQVE